MKVKTITIVTAALLLAIRIVPTQKRFTTNAKNTEIISDYKTESYQVAVQERESLADQCQGFSFCGDILHNLGNSYFFLGKETTDTEQKKNYWYQALNAYGGALAISKDPETQHNYDEIAKLLGEPTSEESQQNQDTENTDQEEESENNTEGEQENSQEGSEDANQAGKSEESNDSEQENETQGGEEGTQEESGEGQDSLGSEQQEQPSSLSENQQQQLQQYAEMLEQQQVQNQQFFNKEQQAKQNPLDALFGIPSLRQQINPNSNQKDW